MIRCTMSDCCSCPALTMAPPTISGTATAPAYIASTCWMDSGISRLSGGMSSTARSRCAPFRRIVVSVEEVAIVT